METKLKKPHNLSLENRCGLKLTGVTDVDSFDEETVTAYTDYGCLTVNGSKLHVEELNLDTGLLEVTGEVTALIYSSKTEKSQGLFKRMFS
ncbi:MAG: sporulation protein YabP [Eubacterium sp.]|nr:sporulation protein YabP [Eubacterium sp.]